MSLSIALIGPGALGACASRNGNSQAEPTPPSIDSLTLLPVAIPATLTVENRGARGALGMLGFLGSIAASHTANKNAELLGAQLKASGIDLRSRFDEAVMRELASGPLLPAVAPDDQRNAKAREADDFRILGLETDAVLDITVSSLGFYSSSGMDDYTPQIYVDMGLRSPKTSDWMGNASYAYDRSPSNGYQRHFQTSAEHKFSSIETLLADRARVIEALDNGIGKIAGGIAVDVKTVLQGRFLE